MICVYRYGTGGSMRKVRRGPDFCDCDAGRPIAMQLRIQHVWDACNSACMVRPSHDIESLPSQLVPSDSPRSDRHSRLACFPFAQKDLLVLHRDRTQYCDPYTDVSLFERTH